MRTARGVFFLFVTLTLFIGVPGQAQSAPLTITPEVQYIFGQQITFRASIRSDIPIQEVLVFFQAQGDPNTIIGVAMDDGETVVYVHDVTGRYVQVFSTVEYWFRVTLEGGEVQTSETFSFFYGDNRFVWQTLEGPPFRVHWYEGDVSFAQFVLDTARLGVVQSARILDAEPPANVDIYAYANLDDYQLARGLMGPLWAGGHADPKVGLIVVSLPDGVGQQLNVERKIPHEVAHIMLYQAAGEGFWNLPTWLNEGFASMMELNPNPDYHFLLATGFENDVLLPLSVLCAPFPRDASGAVLSYAESTAFVRYLEQTYGPAGVRALVREYGGGAGCENGPLAAPFNKTLARLERDWRGAAFSENVTLTALSELSPWLALMAAILLGPLIAATGTLRRRPLSEQSMLLR
ncbi:MAG: peptidase MA family metallohydrolase [Anaerolineales bacterium]